MTLTVSHIQNSIKLHAQCTGTPDLQYHMIVLLVDHIIYFPFLVCLEMGGKRNKKQFKIDVACATDKLNIYSILSR